ncbi:unnamed protein product, partial [Mesorhabditis belari]|uniref:Uncharacterized protein n=1 Tax=Mesorhabditis belari TaxID=2138241 RepID=A0AAF3FS24_9BILA
MGACNSQELKDQSKKSKMIDKELKKGAEGLQQKLLLLGPGESGKSTCLKQIQILHNNGFSKDELREKKIIVLVSTVTYMRALIQACDDFHFVLDAAQMPSREMVERHAMADRVKDLREIPGELHEAIKKLWNDQTIHKCYEMRSSFHLPDSASYFFENLDRICEEGYVPTPQDILHIRVPTTGVVRMGFKARQIDFEVYDVGGQRSERRKWIHCFDNVNALIFIVAISEYDQLLREDDKTNRLLEALELYDSVVNSRYFANSSMILFLNKKDLFAEKIVSISLKVCFHSYRGALTYEDGIEYLKKQFRKLNKRQKKVYTHETCATDTSQVQVVIASVIDTIIQENLRDTGMI